MKDLDARYARGENMQRGAAAGRQMAQPAAEVESDPQLIALLRTVINKQASQEAVQEAAAKVDAYIKENSFGQEGVGANHNDGRQVRQDRECTARRRPKRF